MRFVRRDKMNVMNDVPFALHDNVDFLWSILYRRDTDFHLTTMLESGYMHRGRTLKAVVEGHPDEIFGGSRGTSRKA